MAPAAAPKDATSVSEAEVEAYLTSTVVPTLQAGLVQLAQERPARPLRWLAKYLAAAEAQ